jgi:UPF0755 protein
MKNRNYPLSCIALLGMLIALAFAAFIAASSLIARAANSFGPPSPALGAFQRARLGIELGWRADALLRPVDPAAETINFDIGLDEPTGDIVARMQAAGLIPEANLFSDYLVYTGLDTQLQAGDFVLSPSMNAPQIAAALLDPTPESVTLVVLPGWRLEEIAAALPSAGVGVKPEDFLLAAWNPPTGAQLPQGFPSGASLEGYLLPGSYEIDRELDTVGLLNTLLGGFESNISSDLIAGFEQQGLSLHEALTLASIVEREAVIDGEMPMIASVFDNRLAAGIKLEADPTVQYALGYDQASRSWWRNPLNAADLNVDSEYNTYANFGLPPSPIAAPSLAALQAVAHPTNSNFYFFQAACDGSGAHVFAETFAEHLANNCQ